VEKESATPQNGALFYVEHKGPRGADCSMWNMCVYFAGSGCGISHWSLETWLKMSFLKK